MKHRDYIYYDYRFLGIKPKKWYWRLYCKIRKFITLGESPSKVCLWDLEKESDLNVSRWSKSSNND